MTIHPSAIIEDGAQIGADVSIGPFCIVGAKVVLHDRVELKSHVVVTGDTKVGADTTIFPFCCIGEIPQDVKFKGEAAKLIIGERNRIREHVTMNPGTEGGGGITSIGDDGFFLAGCHVAHDAHVGDRVTIVNQSAIAGHCVIEDDVIIGGLCGIHQFVRIGRGAIIGALSMVTNDVIPHGLVVGPRGELDGLNLVGLKRRGVDRQDITALRVAFQTLKDGEGSFMDRARRLEADSDSKHVSEMMDFILGETIRNFLTPR
ncbi:MAG: UDP-N-acetylglucosamine acyltransferase [Octadecabacter sp.]|jgi:UDP-N-acetylglucosamine acyltransferase